MKKKKRENLSSVISWRYSDTLKYCGDRNASMDGETVTRLSKSSIPLHLEMQNATPTLQL